MAIRPAVSYIPYDTSSSEQIGDIITFAQFEDGNLLSETHDDTESGYKFDDNSTLAPLISEEEINAMLSGDESDAEPMPPDILKDIRDGSQFHLSINRRDACYKICDLIKQGQT